MTIHTLKIRSLAGVLAFGVLSCAQMDAQESDHLKEIGRTTEKEIKVVLSSSFGNVSIGKGDPGKIATITSDNPADESPKMTIDYTVRNRIGYLEIDLGQDSKDNDGGIHISSIERGSWSLRFSDALPISFDIELGVGRGDLNMSGLQVKDLNLSTGASAVNLDFSEANALEIENLTVESGVSHFDGRNLLNARFKNFHFQGGVGSYALDFGGPLKGEVQVDVEVGLGFMTLTLPKEIGARVLYEKNWVSRLDCDEDFETNEENEYLSTNYYRARGKMNITLDSGLGSIKVRRR